MRTPMSGPDHFSRASGALAASAVQSRSRVIRQRSSRRASASSPSRSRVSSTRLSPVARLAWISASSAANWAASVADARPIVSPMCRCWTMSLIVQPLKRVARCQSSSFRAARSRRNSRPSASRSTICCSIPTSPALNLPSTWRETGTGEGWIKVVVSKVSAQSWLIGEAHNESSGTRRRPLGGVGDLAGGAGLLRWCRRRRNDQAHPTTRTRHCRARPGMRTAAPHARSDRTRPACGGPVPYHAARPRRRRRARSRGPCRCLCRDRARLSVDGVEPRQSRQSSLDAGLLPI